ncbi:MAG: GNAT family N-acetyltransferase [Candidatus Hermodarchaeota archaeon]
MEKDIIMDKSLLELSSMFETSRLILRKYEKGDGKEFFQLLETGNNREDLIEHIAEATSIKSEEEAEVRIQELSSDWLEQTRFVMGIWLKSSNKYVGQIWIEPNKWEVPSFELGWYLDQSFQGQGIATEAAKASIKFIFENLQAHKIIVITRDDNERSSKLAERLGFHKEGHLREHSVKKNGTRVGLLYYGILKNEWKESL